MNANALIDESSLYLQQHAHNPVHWYPWGETALNKAKAENKPILLSIGYASCHWCHKMAEESFEDNETAAVMNEHFINIKVDREIRPDLDKIYQLALQILSGKLGGWPLTIFITPDQHLPFFGGTYFPKVEQYGLPDFKSVLNNVAQFFHHQKKDLQEITAHLANALTQLSHAKTYDGALSTAPIETIRTQLKERYDPMYGGFTDAPKFPNPQFLRRLLQDATDADAQDALTLATTTLDKMAQGGIYDHIGGGFFRYAIDEAWEIPHFEKMLYDNAQLLPLYAQAFTLTQDPRFARTAKEIAAWAQRDMQSPNGAFYASINADSEGQEGQFYTWSRETVDELLEQRDFAIVASYFGLLKPANFNQQWHLHVASNRYSLSKQMGIPLADIDSALESSKNKLLHARNTRPKPECDTKIITAWNALMIDGLATAGRLLEDDSLIDAAIKTLTTLKKQAWDGHTLTAVMIDGKKQGDAFLDDYAYLIQAILAVLDARFDDATLQWAVELAQVLCENFFDNEEGGFFFTSHQHEHLIQRTKSYYDEAMPAGNAIAAIALLELSTLTGQTKWRDYAEKTLRNGWHDLNQSPLGCVTLSLALDNFLSLKNGD